MISFDCPHCAKALRLKDELAGKKGKCPACGKSITVPSASENRTLSLADPPNRSSAPPETHDSGPNIQSKVSAAERASTQSLMPAAGKISAVRPEETLDDATAKPVSIPPVEFTEFLSAPEAPDEIGRLGHYRVLKVLGRGGMGVVFQAEETRLKRMVALKAMLPTLAASATAKERFLREAQSAAAIEHDHIVPIYYVGEDRGIPFIAMPLLAGESMDDRLRRGPLPIPEVIRIGRETCLALAAAHEKGLIHRDIKPANLWLEGKSGRVKILDFGLAKVLADGAHLTHSGMIVGTPAYMAPEQARAEPVDHRGDLFSVGCVLYRAASGEMPFKGNSAMSILASLAVTTPKPLKDLKPEVPPALSDLVMRLLDKDPLGRPASAEEVADTLKQIADTAPPLAEPPASLERPPPRATRPSSVARRKVGAMPVRTRRKVYVLVGLFALACLMATVGFLMRGRLPEGEFLVDAQDDATAAAIDAKGGLKVIGRKGSKEFQVKAGTARQLPVGDYDLVALPGVEFSERNFEVKNKETAKVRVWLKKDTPPKVPVKVTTPAGTTPPVADERTFTDAGGKSIPYRLARPESLDPKQKYPLIVFLNSAPQRGNDNKKQLNLGAPAFLTPEMKKQHPCFLVAPQCPSTSTWAGVSWTAASHTLPEKPTEPIRLTFELISSLLKELPIDHNRIYLTGMSDGGFGTWDMAARNPDLFAAAVPLCGGGDEATAPDLTKLAIWVFHGAKDTTVKVSRARNMVAAIKKSGGNPRYTEFPELQHDIWRQSYGDPEFITWLFAQRRGVRPRPAGE